MSISGQAPPKVFNFRRRLFIIKKEGKRAVLRASLLAEKGEPKAQFAPSGELLCAAAPSVFARLSLSEGRFAAAALSVFARFPSCRKRGEPKAHFAPLGELLYAAAPPFCNIRRRRGKFPSSGACADKNSARGQTEKEAVRPCVPREKGALRGRQY